MAKNKTTETLVNASDFINAIADEIKRNDSFQIIEMMQKQTGFEPKMWGPSIVGFGSYHYKYESGREGDMPLVCFSPRSAAIVFYLSKNLENREELLRNLGKHKADGGCVYVKKLADINLEVLKTLINNSIAEIQRHYPN